MKLTHPVIITARLLPGVQIGKSYLSIEWAKDGTRAYTIYLDTPDFEYSDSHIRPGAGKATLQQGLEAALSFLEACGEAYRYKMSTGIESENYTLYPEHVAEWAYIHSDEISTIDIALSEGIFIR